VSKIIQQIANIFLLLVFLTPSVIKLEHNHERFACKAEHIDHFHEYHDNCAVCNFEFSAFSPQDYHFEEYVQITHIIYQNLYKSQRYSNSLKHTFSLRGPPYKLI